MIYMVINVSFGTVVIYVAIEITYMAIDVKTTTIDKTYMASFDI